MIVATAGHVDHGKTTLVRALTGVDTDRLAEEKRRGLTIETGFAYTSLGEDLRLGLVDVPGHQRFIHNMLACVAGIDAALLVVAADDGPMPQTHEHLALLGLLEVPGLLVALTRIDRVSAARQDAACREIHAMLAGGAYAAAPVYPVSAPSGTGIESLRAALQTHGERLRRAPPDGGFRLAVDRSFVLHGVGVVVTGMVFDGRVCRDDTLLQAGHGRVLRVRGLRAEDRPADSAAAGQRVALDVAAPGLQATTIRRGDWLVAPGLEHASERLDASIRLLPDAARPLRHWSQVHLHVAAAHRTARVAVLGAGSVAPGEQALVQLVLDAPLHAVRGDRVILREHSGRTTLGGGRVLDPISPRRGRARPERLRWLQAMSAPSAEQALRAALLAMPAGVSLQDFATTGNLPVDRCRTALAAVAHVEMAEDAGTRVVAEQHWREWSRVVLATVDDFHARHPQQQGPDLNALTRALPGRPPLALVAAAVAALVEQQALARRGLLLHRPAHQVRLESGQDALWQRAASALAPPAGSAPSLHQLGQMLGVEAGALRALLNLAVQCGLAAGVARNRYLPLEVVRSYATQIEELAVRHGAEGFAVTAFRDHTGIGRNFAIDLLEYFDRIGLTRRHGDRRWLASRPATLFDDTRR